MQDKIKAALKAASELETLLKEIKSISDERCGDSAIEDILNASDSVELSHKQNKALEKQIESAFAAVAPGKDCCDEINDVVLTCEEIIREVVAEHAEKQDKALQELQQWIIALQKKVDEDLDDMPDAENLIADLEWQALGVERGNVYQMCPVEQALLFSPGMYKPLHDNPPSRFVPRAAATPRKRARR